MIASAAVLEELSAYQPAAEGERESLARIEELLRRAADPFTREHRDHITGSAVVARPDGSAFLLVYHRRLQRWLQPGGHVESADGSVLATALREAREETGVAALEIANGGRILDLDVHPIPATPKRPAHVHHDLRYLLTTRSDATVAEPLEIEKVAWFSMDEALASGADESLARALRKARRILAGPPDRLYQI
ncbi:MAG TPA: NUDIX hydrolase [Thermoanaerobaculia bacterium]